MEAVIRIYLEVSDEDTLKDLVRIIELIAPYTADNVVVTSEIKEEDNNG